MYQRITIFLTAIGILIVSYHVLAAQAITESVTGQQWEFFPLFKSSLIESSQPERNTVSNVVWQQSVEVNMATPQPELSFYAKSEQLAEIEIDGQHHAIAYLERINQYLKEKGLPIPPEEVEVGFRTTINGTNIVVRGVEPYYLKLYNEPSVETLTDLQTYIDVRKQALEQLDSEEFPDVIEVSISFEEYIDLAELWVLKSTYQIDIDAMAICLIVDDDELHSTMYFADPVDVDNEVYVGFETSIDGFMEQIQRAMADTVGKPESDRGYAQFLSDMSQVAFTTDWIRAKVTIENAQSLESLDDIMLVDPISDFSSQYSDQVLDVLVVDVPNLHAKREILRSLER